MTTPTTPTVRDWNGIDSIPTHEWSKDHWSTLAYLETRCVDYGGIISNDRMRCNAHRHRKLMEQHQITVYRVNDVSVQYPTRLAADVELPRHDDWDCLEDLVAAELIEILEKQDTNHGALFGGLQVTVRMTQRGMTLCGALRAHKAQGGTFSSFDFRLTSPIDSTAQLPVESPA